MQLPHNAMHLHGQVELQPARDLETPASFLRRSLAQLGSAENAEPLLDGIRSPEDLKLTELDEDGPNAAGLCSGG